MRALPSREQDTRLTFNSTVRFNVIPDSRIYINDLAHLARATVGPRFALCRRVAAVVTDTGRVRCRYSPRQYLGYTAVRYPELSRNVARSDAAVRELDDPLPDYIR